MSYLGRSAKLSLKAQEKVSFLATAGQTSKTGLSYTPSFIEVYVNGVLLTDTTDFTATNGNSITFTVALLLNDEVTVISLKTFTVADHYSKTEADTLLAAKAPVASPSFTGNVGVGESSPLGKLHIKTADSGATVDAGADELVIEGSGNAGMSILTGASSTGSIYFGDSGTNWDGYVAYSQTTRSMTLGVAAGGGSVKIDSAGHAIIGGGVTLGNGTTYAAANTLDDYEEGTWTFAMTGSTGSVGSYTQAGAVGTYTKIGDMVYFNGTSYVSDKGSYTGNLIIEGLPFASNASTNVAASVSGLPISAFGANVYGALINADNTFITFRRGLYLDDTAAWSELTPNVRVYVSGSYKIA